MPSSEVAGVGGCLSAQMRPEKHPIRKVETEIARNSTETPPFHIVGWLREHPTPPPQNLSHLVTRVAIPRGGAYQPSVTVGTMPQREQIYDAEKNFHFDVVLVLVALKISAKKFPTVDIAQHK